MNQLYLRQGTVALSMFPLLTIVSGNRNLAMPVTSLTYHLVATMNQLYLATKDPGIIALHSFLHLQPCRVTATGISFSLHKSHQFAAVAPKHKPHQFAAEV